MVFYYIDTMAAFAWQNEAEKDHLRLNSVSSAELVLIWIPVCLFWSPMWLIKPVVVNSDVEYITTSLLRYGAAGAAVDNGFFEPQRNHE